MSDENKNDEEEVVIDAKPKQPKKKATPSAKEIFSLANLPVFIAILAVFFAVFGQFLYFCGAFKAVQAFAIIVGILLFGSVGTLLANCILKKDFRPSWTWAIIAFACFLFFQIINVTIYYI